MSKRNRFFIPAYLLNTIRIKLGSNWKKLTRGSYPFPYFKDKIIDDWDGKYTLHYKNSYKSLLYFNYDQAKVFHDGHSSITTRLIIALVHHNSVLVSQAEDRSSRFADEILANAIEDEHQLSFMINESYDRFNLSGQYMSGIVQGKAASFFIRCYQSTNESKWMELAKKSLYHYDLSVENGGIKRTLPNDMEWMEEYPSPRTSMVLNGFLFWLIGLGEYCAISKDQKYIEVFECHLRSAINWLPAFRLGSGLLYSMYRWNHCNVHYLAIMKYQFEHLYELTGVVLFKEYAEHCDRHTNWSVFKELIGVK